MSKHHKPRIFDFLEHLILMKNIPRSGWIYHNIPLSCVESVAAHSFSACLISMLLADTEIRRGARVKVERVLRMGLLHDLAESLTFDISKAYLDYLGARGGKIKMELENSAWRKITGTLPDRFTSRAYARLQDEYAKEKTLESRIVHSADALDILLQVVNYERQGFPRSSLNPLWVEAVEKVRRLGVPSAQKICTAIMDQGKPIRKRPR